METRRNNTFLCDFTRQLHIFEISLSKANVTDINVRMKVCYEFHPACFPRQSPNDNLQQYTELTVDKIKWNEVQVLFMYAQIHPSVCVCVCVCDLNYFNRSQNTK